MILGRTDFSILEKRFLIDLQYCTSILGVVYSDICSLKPIMVCISEVLKAFLQNACLMVIIYGSLSLSQNVL